MSTQSIREAAASYIARGWSVVPLIHNDKACKDAGWTKLKFKPEDFREGDNLGLRSLGGIVDVDCDASEVVALSADLLPKTGAVYGREGKRKAHWLYTCPEITEPIVYRDLGAADLKKATLVEIRVNHQSMAPPSVHPDGQQLEWEGGAPGEATAITSDDLQRVVKRIATAALIVRYYNPPGNRHEWMLALAGVLRQLGLNEEETRQIVAAAARHAHDPKADDRVQEVRTTFARSESEPALGGKKLREFNEQLVKSLRKIWSTDSFFIWNEKGTAIVPNNQDNVRKALEKLGMKLEYDRFREKLVCNRGPLDDAMLDRAWLEIDKRFNFRPTREFFETVVRDTARTAPFHPVLDWLDTLKWDGVPRAARWLVTYGGASDDEYVRSVGMTVLVAAVRRVRHPGCKFDELLVLESSQGYDKSTAMRTLCHDENWFSDDLPLGVESKQIIENTTGKWIIEAAEMVKLRKAQVEHLKSFLSRQIDGPVRLAYARQPVERPRQFVIIGTTNSHAYLRDSTGNRRFWPVRVQKFDTKSLRRDRDQLWAEACYLETKGMSIRLDPKLYGVAEERQEDRRHEDPWETVLSEKFPVGKLRLVPDDIWNALGIPIERRDERGAERISVVMQRLGFKRMSIRKNRIVVKGWGRDDVQAEISEENE